MMSQDEEHLKLLKIFHYIVGGLAAFFSCFFLIHVAFGLTLIFSPNSFVEKPGDHPPPPFVGWLLLGIGGFLFLAGQSMATCILLSARFLAQKKRYYFVFAIACVECLFVPFGTVLGIFTILVLSRESVKNLFGLDSRSS